MGNRKCEKSLNQSSTVYRNLQLIEWSGLRLANAIHKVEELNIPAIESILLTLAKNCEFAVLNFPSLIFKEKNGGHKI